LERFEVQERALEKIRSFTTSKNVHTSLVIHPRKEDESNLLSVSSIFGSAKATQEADNVVILQKGQFYRYLDVRKNRFDGELGIVPFRFDKSCRRYSEIPPEELSALPSDD
jgi:twinkle protein